MLAVGTGMRSATFISTNSSRCRSRLGIPRVKAGTGQIASMECRSHEHAVYRGHACQSRALLTMVTDFGTRCHANGRIVNAG